MISVKMFEQENIKPEDFSGSSLCPLDWQKLDKCFVAYNTEGEKKIVGFIQLNQDESYRIDFIPGFSSLKTQLISQAFYCLEREKLRKRISKLLKPKRLNSRRIALVAPSRNTSILPSHSYTH